LSFLAELEAACDLAREAGRGILTHYDRVHAGGAEALVAAADRESSNFIVSSLRRLFPDDAILTEESKDDVARLAKRRVWIVDPLDGSREFVARNGEFTVMIGLAVAGEPAVGVVFQPTTATLYGAARESGAFVERAGERTPLAVSALVNPEAMVLVVSRSHRDSRVNDVKTLLGLGNETVSGSVGLKIGMIAEQRCDLYVHPTGHTKLWDTCGPQVILTEAGGVLTDCYGEPLRYDRRNFLNHRGIVASNGAAHDVVVDAVVRAMRGEVEDEEEQESFEEM
jgi:3'(2'), 5'-bisphosphate nucleotidase